MIYWWVFGWLLLFSLRPPDSCDIGIYSVKMALTFSPSLIQVYIKQQGWVGVNIIWNCYQLPSSLLMRGKRWRFHGKTHGTQSLRLVWENSWHCKAHGGIHGKTHGAKNQNFQRWWPAPSKQLTYKQAYILKVLSLYLLKSIGQIYWHVRKDG